KFEEIILAQIRRQLNSLVSPFYRKVINAAGIVLHTGLGRAVLPKEALEQISRELSGYSLLQLGIADGKRSSRDSHIEKMFSLLTGAEAATIVNNNAAATSLVLNTIADGKEVIVSRGQLVEIGGSFRLPDVMAFSGAKLVAVGTTNKTHLRDYENAITEETAAILRVHPSNYKIQGFSSEVPLKPIADLAHANGLLAFDDVGAGSLVDFSRFGFDKEPTLAESVADGADIISSSGDKLIGASQAGIILGKADIIKKIKKNQFARIVRVDKMTLVALEATLRLFLNEAEALEKVPTLRMMLRSYDSIKSEAARIAGKLKKANLQASVETVDGFSQTGSGSLPTQNLKTRLVAIASEKISSVIVANKLRHYRTPIFTRIQDEKILIDPRTLLEGEAKVIIEVLSEILS
ncbi:MAG: L-seryl-tRNA(Sec) selenium transferase, partial [Proteobacteria bacterium]|nr:L-seryl-tRNA(Sec) selenium transferase [Pseudomonadota bacterium]